MPDKDMRKAALNVSKTASNKISSRRSTPVTSTRGSRAASRIASRNVSDDEDWNSVASEDTNQSINSVDALLESDDFREDDLDLAASAVDNKINLIIERKGTNNEVRELYLASFNSLLSAHHHGDSLYNKTDQLLEALKKSIKNESFPHEVILALKSVSLIGISIANDNLYESMHTLLKTVINDREDNPSKAAAIHCLSVCASFGGASEAEIESICEFLQEIITSDGEFVNATDDSDVVTAALQVYAYLCTEITDMEDDSEDAIEGLYEQLDSSSVSVQIAAGEAIALLFEKSFRPKTSTETSSEESEDDFADGHNISVHEDAELDKNLVRRYNAYHNPGQIQEKVHDLAHLSSKSMNKKEKARLHKAMSCIEMTVEDPRRGLWANNSSMRVVRIQKDSEIKVDKWWKYLRLNMLRRLLGGGFVNHYYEGNKMVLNSLPVLMMAKGLRSPGAKKARKGDRFREVRKFKGGES